MLKYKEIGTNKFDTDNPVFFSYSVLDELTTSLRNEIECRGRVDLWVSYVDNFFFKRKSDPNNKKMKCCLININYPHFNNIIFKNIANKNKRLIRDSKINVLIDDGSNSSSYSYIELGANEI